MILNLDRLDIGWFLDFDLINVGFLNPPFSPFWKDCPRGTLIKTWFT